MPPTTTYGSNTTGGTNNVDMSQNYRNESMQPSDGRVGNKYLGYLGEPTNVSQKGGNRNYRQTHSDGPEQYEGKNDFLGTMMEGFILIDNDWPTTLALPYKYSEQLHWTWNVCKFDKPLAGIVPTEGMPRLTTFSKSTQTASSVRQGIAFTMEMDFVNQSEGPKAFALNIQQVKTIVQQSNAFDVISTLMSVHADEQAWQDMNGYTNFTLDKKMEQEVEQFGRIQKQPAGLALLDAEYQKHLKRNNVTPNMLIVPPKLRTYVEIVQPIPTYYGFSLPGQSETVDLPGPKAFTKFKDLNVYEMPVFNLDNDNENVSLGNRQVRIGEYNYFADQFRGQPVDRYASHMRNIVVYDEVTNEEVELNLLEAIRHSGRFAKNGELNGTHENFQDKPANDYQDIFAFEHKNGLLQIAQYFGQMEMKYLDSETIHNVGTSATQKYDDQFEDAIADGVALYNELKSLDESPLSDSLIYSIRNANTMDTLRSVVNSVSMQKPLLDVNGNAVMENGRRVMEDPSVPRDENRIGGFASYWGLVRIVQARKASDTIWQRASKFLTAFQILYNDMCARFGKMNPLLNEYNCPVQFKSYLNKNQWGPCTLFEKLIAYDTIPLGLVVNNNTFSEAIQVAWGKEKMQDVPADDGRYLNAFRVCDADTFIEFSELREINMDEGCLILPFVGSHQWSGMDEGDIVHYISPTIIHAKECGKFLFRAQQKNVVRESNLTFNPQMFFYNNSLSVDTDNEDVLLQGNNINHPTKRTRLEDDHMDTSFDIYEQLLQEKHRSTRNSSEPIRHRSDENGDENIPLMSGGFTRNFIEIQKEETNILRKIAKLCFLTTRIVFQSFVNFYKFHVNIPVNVMVSRPFMGYEMSTLIWMKGGPDTGNTYYGHVDFTISIDGHVKMLYGNLTYYEKAIIREDKNIIKAENVMYDGVLGGAGVRFYTDDELTELANNRFIVENGEHIPSYISMIVPHTFTNFRTWIDIRGKKASNDTPHYPTYQFECQNRDLETISSPSLGLLHASRDYKANTVCYQGFQKMWSNGGFNEVITNKGHHGPNVYPGCKSVRQGKTTAYRQVSYHTQV